MTGTNTTNQGGEQHSGDRAVHLVGSKILRMIIQVMSLGSYRKRSRLSQALRLGLRLRDRSPTAPCPTHQRVAPGERVVSRGAGGSGFNAAQLYRGSRARLPQRFDPDASQGCQCSQGRGARFVVSSTTGRATPCPALDDKGKCKTRVPLFPPVDRICRLRDRPRGCLCTHNVNHVGTRATCKPIPPVHRLVRNEFVPSLCPENLIDARIIRQFNRLAAVVANKRHQH
jgi:hypothetical protein